MIVSDKVYAATILLLVSVAVLLAGFVFKLCGYLEAVSLKQIVGCLAVVSVGWVAYVCCVDGQEKNNQIESEKTDESEEGYPSSVEDV